MKNKLNEILNTTSKVKIIRLFVSKRKDFYATGREVGKQSGLSAPAAHNALKDLYNHNILNRDIIGKQHLYRLNAKNRIVKDILIPAFRKELDTKKDISKFLRKEILANNLKDRILSLMVYGSVARNRVSETSDVDIAVIVKEKKDKMDVEKIFIEVISSKFSEYFGVQLDPYIKTETEFLKKIRENKPPVSTLVKAYKMVYGKDPLEIS